jgi:hypothetical protein
MRGGIRWIDDYDDISAFDFFFNNSTIKLFSMSSRGGIIFLVELKERIKSPYILNRSNYPKLEVKTLMLKLCILDLKNDMNQDIYYEYIESIFDDDGQPVVKNLIKLFHTSETEFVNEANYQTDIFEESLDEYLEPICPSIVYSETVSNSKKNVKLDDILSKTDNSEFLQKLFEDLKKKKCNLGLIIMEYMDKETTTDMWHTIQNINSDTSIKEYDKANKIVRVCLFLIYELWRLYKLNFIHGDIGTDGNVLFNSKYKYFTSNPGDEDYDGKIIIIDFGRTLPLNKPKAHHRNVKTHLRKSIMTTPLEELNTDQLEYMLKEIGYLDARKHIDKIYWFSELMNRLYNEPYNIPRHSLRLNFILTELRLLHTKREETKQKWMEHLTSIESHNPELLNSENNVFNIIDPTHKINIDNIGEIIATEVADAKVVMDAIVADAMVDADATDVAHTTVADAIEVADEKVSVKKVNVKPAEEYLEYFGGVVKRKSHRNKRNPKRKSKRHPKRKSKRKSKRNPKRKSRR